MCVRGEGIPSRHRGRVPQFCLGGVAAGGLCGNERRTVRGQVLPPGNDEYVKLVGSRSSKKTRWAFHDDAV